MQRIAMDIGYGYTKATTISPKTKELKTIMFPSVVKEQPQKSINEAFAGGYVMDYALEVNNKKMYIGELALNQSAERKFEKQGYFDCQFIETVASTCLFELSEETDVEIIVGLPLTSFTNQKAVDMVKNCLDNKQFVVKNDKTKTFKVTSVKVTAQGVGAWLKEVMANKDLYEMRVAVLDLGYRTFDVTVVEMSVISESLTTSFEESGMNQLYEEITMAINNEGLGRRYKPSQLEKMVRSNIDLPREINGNKTYREYAEPFKKRYVSNLVSDLRRLWGEEIESVDALFVTGGGGEDLIDLFKQELENAQLQKDSQFANCLGYLKI